MDLEGCRMNRHIDRLIHMHRQQNINTAFADMLPKVASRASLTCVYIIQRCRKNKVVVTPSNPSVCTASTAITADSTRPGMPASYVLLGKPTAVDPEACSIMACSKGLALAVDPVVHARRSHVTLTYARLLNIDRAPCKPIPCTNVVVTCHARTA
jgi:hypothetical protein